MSAPCPLGRPLPPQILETFSPFTTGLFSATSTLRNPQFKTLPTQICKARLNSPSVWRCNQMCTHDPGGAEHRTDCQGRTFYTFGESNICQIIFIANVPKYVFENKPNRPASEACETQFLGAHLNKRTWILSYKSVLKVS